MPILKNGSKVGLIATSNGLDHSSKPNIDKLIDILTSLGLSVVLSDTIYKRDGYFSGTPKERANELTKLFLDRSIDAVFDISGGDSCNQILLHLDFELISQHKKLFVGYSDVTVLINSLLKFSKNISLYYNLHNLYGRNSERQLKYFKDTLFDDSLGKISISYSWLNGTSISGVVIGGNLRCFLKLAGTKFMPNPKGKILLLEAYSGNYANITSLVSQLEHLGFFNKISGVILGNFFEIEKRAESTLLSEHFTNLCRVYELPLIKTNEIGHRDDSLGMFIGKRYEFVD